MKRPVINNPSRQQGASLVIGLVLLLVLSVLAVSTMNSATFGLTMAGNMQYSENAFQLAETGIEVAINNGPFCAGAGCPANAIAQTQVLDTGGRPIGTYQVNTNYQVCTMRDGYSANFRAYHFRITSVGQSSRGAQSQNQQEFFLIGPDAC
jgi:type IV pilus assembly protein PilX